MQEIRCVEDDIIHEIRCSMFVAMPLSDTVATHVPELVTYLHIRAVPCFLRFFIIHVEITVGVSPGLVRSEDDRTYMIRARFALLHHLVQHIIDSHNLQRHARELPLMSSHSRDHTYELTLMRLRS